MTKGRVGHLNDVRLCLQQLGVVDFGPSLVRRWRPPTADNVHPGSKLLILLHLTNIGMLVLSEEDGQVGSGKFCDIPPLRR